MTSPHVIIIGGQAGGMSCATRLRRLNEKWRITVIEKSPYISSGTCGIPYALGHVIQDEAKLHVLSLDKAKSWFNINVMTQTQVVSIDTVHERVAIQKVDEDGASTADAIELMPYDKLIIATGAEATKPPIPGIDAANVFTLKNLRDLQKTQHFLATHSVKTMAVIGASFIGLEATENLANLGYQVVLLESLPHVMSNLDPELAEILHAEIRHHGVKLMLGAQIAEVKHTDAPTQSVISLRNGKEVHAEAIILAAGVHPTGELAKEASLDMLDSGAIRVDHCQRTADTDIYAIGDVAATECMINHDVRPVYLAGPANRQGRIVADVLSGRDKRFRGHVGTSVCKVFGLTVGSVGLSPQQLHQAGRKFDYVTVHPPDHAAYYPDARQMVLRVAFELGSGRLLGAQAVGQAGVDKRIDVLATAIQAGMAIGDLEDLELGYAPQYGAAKDAVNMAGFVGSNVLKGDVQVVHIRDMLTDKSLLSLPYDYQIVDVRSPEEYRGGHLSGAINIPLGELRDHANELDQDRATLVYCWVGYRGYLAYRILTQLGFKDVVNLDGGLKMVSHGGYKDLIMTTREESEFGC